MNLDRHNAGVIARRSDDPPDYYEEPEWATTARNAARKIINHYGGLHWGEVQRLLDRYGDITLAILPEGGEWAYSRLEQYNHKSPIVAVRVSGRPPGEAEIPATVIDLTKRGTRKTGSIVEQFGRACDEQRAEAEYIWESSQGCEDCGLGEGEYGGLVVNPDCKTCEGGGVWS